MLFTDGAKYVADEAGAYWLLDEIALAQRYQTSVAGEAFQLWKLQVDRRPTAMLTCEDGNGRAVYSKAIEYTDFPLPETRAVLHRPYDLAAERVLSRAGAALPGAPLPSARGSP